MVADAWEGRAGAGSLKSEIEEINANRDDHDADNPVEYLTADPGLLLDRLAESAAHGADRDQRDAQPNPVDQHGEKSLQGGLVERNPGQHDDQHRGPPPYGDRTEREPEQERARHRV